MKKTSFAATISAVLGIAVASGVWAVYAGELRNKLADAEQNLAVLQEQLASERAPVVARNTVVYTPVEKPAEEAAPAAAAEETPPPPAEEVREDRPRRGPDFRNMTEEERQKMRDEWRARNEQRVKDNLDKFLNNENISEDQYTKISGIIDNTVARTSEVIDQWTEFAEKADDIYADDVMRFLRDLNNAIIEGYDELDEQADGWRDAKENFELTDIIDGEKIGPLMRTFGMRGAFRGFMGMGPMGGGGGGPRGPGGPGGPRGR